jgi:hypothetical protein
MNVSHPTPEANHGDHPPPTDEGRLNLAVHSLPSDQALVNRQSQLGARLKLLLLLLVCCAPVVASYITYYFVRPEGRHNFGDLIDPQQPLPSVMAKNQQGANVALSALRGQWLLITVSKGPCTKVCQDNLYYQRQLRELMGKNKDRVDKVTLLLDDTPLDPQLQPALKDVTLLRADANAISAWLTPQPNHALDDHLYVVDPLGNWMMRFPPITDRSIAAKAKRDLERLMRASSFWDQAGRN